MVAVFRIRRDRLKRGDHAEIFSQVVHGHFRRGLLQSSLYFAARLLKELRLHGGKRSVNVQLFAVHGILKHKVARVKVIRAYGRILSLHNEIAELLF